MKEQVPKLKPSKRPKKRYLLFEIKSKEKTNSFFAKKEIIAFLKGFFKEKFFEKKISFILFSEKKSKGIIRCRREEKENVSKALEKIKKINGNFVQAKTILSSGSLLKLKQKIFPKKN
jgi:RNase P/RNase MRP subunit POP5